MWICGVKKLDKTGFPKTMGDIPFSKSFMARCLKLKDKQRNWGEQCKKTIFSVDRGKKNLIYDCVMAANCQNY